MKQANTSVLAFFVASLGLLASASANTIAISAPPEDPIPKRVEFDIGMMVGSLDLGTTSADATGIVLSAGMRLGELSLLAEFNHFSLQASELGSMNRVGAVARYSIVPLGDEESFATGDLWVEAGAGYEHINWRRGGVLDRPDMALGFGWQGNFVMDAKSDHPRYFGPYFAMRALVAPGPPSDVAAVCGGPCGRATTPSATDVSFMFHMGVNWGRTSF
ncbi:MAG: hypothetical protein JKY56_20155 [Kofleriaceae bacterium]|nr:hypothetical protein [Kofleriaceae bacterium]